MDGVLDTTNHAVIEARQKVLAEHGLATGSTGSETGGETGGETGSETGANVDPDDATGGEKDAHEDKREPLASATGGEGETGPMTPEDLVLKLRKAEGQTGLEVEKEAPTGPKEEGAPTGATGAGPSEGERSVDELGERAGRTSSDAEHHL